MLGREQSRLVSTHGSACDARSHARSRFGWRTAPGFAVVFDVVDLDPNGSSLAYIDSALGCLSDDGLLAATFTDMNVLCDHTALGLCFSKYGSAPLSEPYILENATRMLLYTINTLAIS